MPAFSSFDRRRYETVSVREGYRQWSSSYEDTIKKDMDLWLLKQISTVRWNESQRAADLGCGTGRPPNPQWASLKDVRVGCAAVWRLASGGKEEHRVGRA